MKGSENRVKRGLIAATAVFALLLAAFSAAYIYGFLKYTVIGSETPLRPSTLCRRDVRELDLSGVTLSDLEGIERCRELESLNVSGSDIGDISAIKELSSLRSLDLTGCGLEPERFTEIADALPECDILWDVPIAGQHISSEAESVTLTDAADADYELLAYLRNLKNVELIDCDISPRLLELRADKPECNFSWTVNICGNELDCGTTELDLNEREVDETELTAALRSLPDMKHVELCDSGLSNEQMEKLMTEFPEIRFVWKIHLGAWDIRTDVTNFSCGHLKPVSKIASERVITNEAAQQLKYCTGLVALDLGHTRVSDLSFLESLTKLRSLIMVDCPISDITPIGKLVNLQYLELFEDDIEDISALASLKELREVNLCLNGISDATPLYELEKLEKVWISDNYLQPPQQRELRKNLPDGCKSCFELDRHRHPCSQGWRPIDYRLWGFRYEHPLNEGMNEKQAASANQNKSSANIDPDAYADE